MFNWEPHTHKVRTGVLFVTVLKYLARILH